MGLSKIIFAPAFLCLGFFCSCDDDEVVPRPKGYFRIDLPEKNYSRWDSTCPFSFEVPGYCVVRPDHDANSQPCWVNLEYVMFGGTLHLSYKKVNNDLDTFLLQSRQMAIQHQVKANAMKESPVINDSAGVYGLIYEFGGNTASSLQFYLTDSTNHFIRGALYFWARPNADSLAPVLEFISQDVYKMVETFRWKK